MKRIDVLMAPALLALVLAACAAGNRPGATPGPTAAPAPLTPTLPTPELIPTATGEPAADATAPDDALSPAALGQATYGGILEQPVTLAGGRFEGRPATGEAASRPVVTLLPQPRLYGDLDGDGRVDAVVLLAAESGGSGTFVHLAVVVAEDGRPVNLATTPLGDRARVEGLRVEDGRLVVTLLTHGPDDPMCCPTQAETRVYQVEGDELVRVESN